MTNKTGTPARIPPINGEVAVTLAIWKNLSAGGFLFRAHVSVMSQAMKTPQKTANAVIMNNKM